MTEHHRAPRHVVPTTRAVHRGVAVGVLCLAAFTINLDTTIVNIALPSLMRQLDASTRELPQHLPRLS
jgi:hypothetical protein